MGFWQDLRTRLPFHQVVQQHQSTLPSLHDLAQADNLYYNTDAIAHKEGPYYHDVKDHVLPVIEHYKKNGAWHSLAPTPRNETLAMIYNVVWQLPFTQLAALHQDAAAVDAFMNAPHDNQKKTSPPLCIRRR